jgi:NAD(P)-dependent dehydrogenase (short-subunit alcohol dehydrogenase family)
MRTRPSRPTRWARSSSISSEASMRVLVTGATGYLGSHAAAAVVRSGHDVRALVRSPDRVATSLGPLGVSVPDVAVGDITDPASIEAALTGCDAVVHAASVYSLDPRDAPVIAATNVRGTETVLGAAGGHRSDRLRLELRRSSSLARRPRSRESGGEADATVRAIEGRFGGCRSALSRAGRSGGQRLPRERVGTSRPLLR